MEEKEAKKYAEELFKSKMKGFEKKFIIKHTRGVVKTAVKLAKGKKIDLESLKVACWLHDIGRTENIEGHAVISIRIAEKKFGKLNQIIIDCILNHSSSKDPQTEEGKIMQLADKLSIMNDFSLIKALFSKEKYKEKSLELMSYVSKDLIEVLKKYNW